MKVINNRIENNITIKIGERREREQKREKGRYK